MGGGGGLQRLVQHKGNLLRQTHLVLLVLGLHCTAVQGAHSNFCLRRERELLNSSVKVAQTVPKMTASQGIADRTRSRAVRRYWKDFPNEFTISHKGFQEKKIPTYKPNEGL